MPSSRTLIEQDDGELFGPDPPNPLFAPTGFHERYLKRFLDESAECSKRQSIITTK